MRIKEMLKMNILNKTVKRFKEVKRRKGLKTYKAVIGLPSGEEFYVETKAMDVDEAFRAIETYISEENVIKKIKRL